MSDIDWSKAPDGATHYDPTDDGMNMPWMKLSRERWYAWDDGWHGPLTDNDGWIKDGTYSVCIPRPTKQEWEGGLPPAGVECEALFMHGASTKWRKCKVLMHGERECAVFVPELNAIGWCNTFRPLKSKAERQREELEDYVYNKVNMAPMSISAVDAAIDAAAEFYEESYNLEPKP